MQCLKICLNSTLEIILGTKLDIGSITDFFYVSDNGQLFHNSDITVENEKNKIVIIEDVLLNPAHTETELDGKLSYARFSYYY